MEIKFTEEFTGNPNGAHKKKYTLHIDEKEIVNFAQCLIKGLYKYVDELEEEKSKESSDEKASPDNPI